MPAILDEEIVVDYSTNDSHIHLDPDAATRRARLQLTLKPGETDEVSVPGTRANCPQCVADGTYKPVVRPSNQTYDLTFATRKRDEMIDLKREVAELKEMLNLQMESKKASKEKSA